MPVMVHLWSLETMVLARLRKRMTHGTYQPPMRCSCKAGHCCVLGDCCIATQCLLPPTLFLTCYIQESSGATPAWMTC